jgi:crotonobetainyl-CoA:carnitine CoA-transferase CaiB-like acyl-CoA transferase
MLASREREDLVERGQSAGLPCSLLNTPAEFVRDPQPRARAHFVTVEHPVMGEVELPWFGFHARPELRAFRCRAPLLGEHNTEIYCDELGHDPSQLSTWKAAGLV